MKSFEILAFEAENHPGGSAFTHMRFHRFQIGRLQKIEAAACKRAAPVGPGLVVGVDEQGKPGGRRSAGHRLGRWFGDLGGCRFRRFLCRLAGLGRIQPGGLGKRGYALIG